MDVPVGWFPQSGLPVPDACFIVNSLWMLTDFHTLNLCANSLAASWYCEENEYF